MQLQRTARESRSDQGFSLVEMLIVVVIVGVLATVAVFTVRGISDRGETSAVEADHDVLETAEESYHAQFGRYATEAELVSSGTLRSPSTLHDVVLEVDGTYRLVVVGASATTTP